MTSADYKVVTAAAARGRYTTAHANLRLLRSIVQSAAFAKVNCAKGPGLLGAIAYICILPFFALGSGLALMVSGKSEYDNPEIHGRDTAVIVAVPVCPECKKEFRRSGRVRVAALRTIGPYRDLLNSYPGSTTHCCSRDGD